VISEQFLAAGVKKCIDHQASEKRTGAVLTHRTWFRVSVRKYSVFAACFSDFPAAIIFSCDAMGVWV